MEYKIVWSPTAYQSFQKVISYLESEWSEKVAIEFVATSKNAISKLARKPFAHRASILPECYELLITKHNLLVYRVKGNMVQIILLWDTRGNPKLKARETKRVIKTLR